jgi:hypothetical protein
MVTTTYAPYNFDYDKCPRFVDFKSLYPSTFIRIVDIYKNIRWKDRIK